jgi:hypothetical protein
MKKQHGFGLVGVLLVLLVLGVFGFAGWHFFTLRQANEAGKANMAKQSATNGQAEKPVGHSEVSGIPDGYLQYKNTGAGFSFAYPKAVGTVSPFDSMDKDAYLVFDRSAQTENDFSPHTQGTLQVMVQKSDGFVTGAGKYGPSLEYDNGKWIVSSKNNGDVNHGTYQIGDTYPAKVARTIGSTLVYDFPLLDEGCHTQMWVFKHGAVFVTIGLPTVCADEMGDIPQDRLDAYQKVSDTVLGTLQIQ